MEKTCQHCGTPFMAERQRNKFCGKPCQHKAARSGDWYVQTDRGYEHRLKMEEHLGRKLLPSEHVHHRNGNRRDNRIENLQVMSNAEHVSLHKLQHPKVKACTVCGATFIPHSETRSRVKTCSKECRYKLQAMSMRARRS